MKNPFIKIAFGFVFTCGIAVGISPSAFSFTECTLEIEKIGSVDGEYIVLFFKNGGIAQFGPNGPNPQNSLFLATSALLENRKIIVKYEADNVECNSQYMSVMGIYLV